MIIDFSKIQSVTTVKLYLAGKRMRQLRKKLVTKTSSVASVTAVAVDSKCVGTSDGEDLASDDDSVVAQPDDCENSDDESSEYHQHQGGCILISDCQKATMTPSDGGRNYRKRYWGRANRFPGCCTGHLMKALSRGECAGVGGASTVNSLQPKMEELRERRLDIFYNRYPPHPSLFWGGDGQDSPDDDDDDSEESDDSSQSQDIMRSRRTAPVSQCRQLESSNQLDKASISSLSSYSDVSSIVFPSPSRAKISAAPRQEGENHTPEGGLTMALNPSGDQKSSAVTVDCDSDSELPSMVLSTPKQTSTNLSSKSLTPITKKEVSLVSMDEVTTLTTRKSSKHRTVTINARAAGGDASSPEDPAVFHGQKTPGSEETGDDGDTATVTATNLSITKVSLLDEMDCPDVDKRFDILSVVSENEEYYSVRSSVTSLRPSSNLSQSPQFTNISKTRSSSSPHHIVMDRNANNDAASRSTSVLSSCQKYSQLSASINSHIPSIYSTKPSSEWDSLTKISTVSNPQRPISHPSKTVTMQHQYSDTDSDVTSFTSATTSPYAVLSRTSPSKSSRRRSSSKSVSENSQKTTTLNSQKSNNTTRSHHERSLSTSKSSIASSPQEPIIQRFFVPDITGVRDSMVLPIKDRRLAQMLARHDCQAALVQAKNTQRGFLNSVISVYAPSLDHLLRIARDVDKSYPTWNLSSQLRSLHFK